MQTYLKFQRLEKVNNPKFIIKMFLSATFLFINILLRIYITFSIVFARMKTSLSVFSFTLTKYIYFCR